MGPGPPRLDVITYPTSPDGWFSGDPNEKCQPLWFTESHFYFTPPLFTQKELYEVLAGHVIPLRQTVDKPYKNPNNRTRPCGDFLAISQLPVHPQRSDRSGSGAKMYVQCPTPKDRYDMHFGTRGQGVPSPPELEWIFGPPAAVHVEEWSQKSRSGEGWENISATTHWDLNGHIGTPGNTPPRGCGDLRLHTPEKSCTLCAERGICLCQWFDSDSPCAPGAPGRPRSNRGVIRCGVALNVRAEAATLGPIPGA